ncbi:unnamed protein product, partial [Sphacelaria rigidula]
MMGEAGGSDKQRGLCARALSHIFRAVRSKKADQTVTVQMSFIEIYNEQLLDLLQRSSPTRQFRE